MPTGELTFVNLCVYADKLEIQSYYYLSISVYVQNVRYIMAEPFP